MWILIQSEERTGVFLGKKARRKKWTRCIIFLPTQFHSILHFPNKKNTFLCDQRTSFNIPWRFWSYHLIKIVQTSFK